MSEIHQMSGKQLAAARVLLGMSQAELAAAALISIPTLGRMEASHGPVSGLRNNVLAVKRALEDAGAIFLSEGETVAGGIGVRIQPR